MIRLFAVLCWLVPRVVRAVFAPAAAAEGMPAADRGVSFPCVNEQCEQEMALILGFDELPGWALCGCGYGYVVDRSCSAVRAFDQSGMVEQYDGEEIPMAVSQPLAETVGVSADLAGRVVTWEPRGELRSQVAAHGAVTVDAVPVPLGLLEEQGVDLPEVYVIKIAVASVPPALRAISEYYAQEVETVREEFEGSG